MRRKVRPRRNPAGAGVGTPVPCCDVRPAEGAADLLAGADAPSVDRGPSFDARDPGQSDIERAIEHIAGSIETALQTEPASAADGFVEPGALDGAGTERTAG